MGQVTRLHVGSRTVRVRGPFLGRLRTIVLGVAAVVVAAVVVVRRCVHVAPAQALQLKVRVRLTLTLTLTLTSE